MLTDAKIKKLKPKDDRRFTKYPDRDGLIIVVYQSRAKSWKWNYRRNQRQHTLTIGSYPAISLSLAREITTKLRTSLMMGGDPSKELKTITGKVSGTKLSTYVDAVIDHDERRHLAKSTIEKRHWLKREISNKLLDSPVSQIETKDLLPQIHKVVAAGHYDKARRMAGMLKLAFSHAVLVGDVLINPAAGLGLIIPPPRPKHHPAITDTEQFAGLLAGIDGRSGSLSVDTALQLQPHVFLRPGELRKGRWDEVDFDKAIWIVPASRMKMRRDHVVPLSQTSVRILLAHRARSSGDLIFPAMGRQGKAISENSMNHALWTLGYKGLMTSHGFRTTASTFLNEMGWNWDWIETQLAHSEKNSVRGAYNRAQYLNGRHVMMDRWSQFLDKLKAYGSGHIEQLPNPLNFGPLASPGGADDEPNG